MSMQCSISTVGKFCQQS